MNPHPIDLILSVMPELAPAYTPGDHRRAAAKLTRGLELADDSPEQTACDEAEKRLEQRLSDEYLEEDRRYVASLASGRIKGAK